MVSQYVHDVSYLAEAVLSLDEIESGFKAIVLPSKARLTHLSIEVLEPDSSTSIDVGLNEETSYFINNLALDSKKSELSSVISSIKEKSFITINYTGKSTAKVALRAIYFLPSKIMTEF